MGQPMHIAVGSLSPQNGFGAGLAFVEHKDYSNEWRATWNATPSPPPTAHGAPAST